MGSWEAISIVLGNVLGCSDYDISLYQGLSNCRNDDSLARSHVAGSADGLIEWRESADFDDGGIYVIHVHPFSYSYSCYSHYHLSIDGLN